MFISFVTQFQKTFIFLAAKYSFKHVSATRRGLRVAYGI